MQRPISAPAWYVLFSKISYMTDKKNIRTIQASTPPSSCNCAETMRVDATDIDKEVKKWGGSQGKRSVKGRRKDGFSSLCCPRLLHRSDKTGDTPNCAVLNLQDTHDWCTESFLSLFASMDSEVCGLHTSSSIISDRLGEKNEIRDWRQNAAGKVPRSPAVPCNYPASTDNGFLRATQK